MWAYSHQRLSQQPRGVLPLRSSSYWDNYTHLPCQANKASFHKEGWFRTGDQGFFDEDNFLVLTGRIKELINRGGEKIAPSEVR